MKNTERKIPYKREDVSLETFVRSEICKSGKNYFVVKRNLEDLCKEKHIKFEKDTTKEEIYDLLISNGCTCKELAKIYNIGVSSYAYQKTFNINHQTVKKMEKKGLINVVNHYKVRAYGKELKVPLYDVSEFLEMSNDTISKFIKDN